MSPSANVGVFMPLASRCQHHGRLFLVPEVENVAATTCDDVAFAQEATRVGAHQEREIGLLLDVRFLAEPLGDLTCAMANASAGSDWVVGLSHKSAWMAVAL